ncbi:MAG TPA: hypothetical protein VK997_01685 [Deferrisomatales bacterium]|nr:hypothetical protein [Deferrisomatales bacterium]
MKMTEIRSRARHLGIKNYSRLTKPKLIRSIQMAEGNQPCFTGIADCGQTDCCWFDDCQESGLSAVASGP